MFTGIIEETGVVERLDLSGHSGKIRIKAKKVLSGTRIGDSIAVNGICLTVVTFDDTGFTADVMSETVKRSSLSLCKAGTCVNLERALALGERFGGHIVSGHIDGTGIISDIRRDENAVRIRIKTPPSILRLIVRKGSIAIDGISLTVADVSYDSFEVSVIPHTGGETTLLSKKKGEPVNLENDVIGKYVERLMEQGGLNAGEAHPSEGSEEKPDKERAGKKSVLDLEYLAEHGF